MKKIESLFIREQVGRKHLATEEVTPGCEWVTAGEGRATVKIDGTCCAIIDGILHRRHRHKEEKGDPPAGWFHWSGDPLQKSGHGWVQVSGKNPSDRYHIEAWNNAIAPADGTYELVGPKIQKNPNGLTQHELWRHGSIETVCPRDFAGVRLFLEANDIEGIVWHHEDGRLVKIKRRDFGLPWPVTR